jgi:oligoribonuclease (3'-5' exoribonuclease)
MAEFSTEVDIDPSEFVSECGRAEKIELIDLIVEECADDSGLKKELIKSIREYFPQSAQEIIDPAISSKNTFMHNEFLDSLNKLSEAYYRLSNEDIEKIKELAKRF